MTWRDVIHVDRGQRQDLSVVDDHVEVQQRKSGVLAGFGRTVERWFGSRRTSLETVIRQLAQEIQADSVKDGADVQNLLDARNVVQQRADEYSHMGRIARFMGGHGDVSGSLQEFLRVTDLKVFNLITGEESTLENFTGEQRNEVPGLLKFLQTPHSSLEGHAAFYQSLEAFCPADKNHEEYIQERLQALSDAGFETAANELGRMQYVEDRVGASAEVLQRAARAGDPDAQYQYAQSLDVDSKERVQMIESSALQGNRAAILDAAQELVDVVRSSDRTVRKVYHEKGHTLEPVTVRQLLCELITGDTVDEEAAQLLGKLCAGNVDRKKPHESPLLARYSNAELYPDPTVEQVSGQTPKTIADRFHEERQILVAAGAEEWELDMHAAGYVLDRGLFGLEPAKTTAQQIYETVKYQERSGVDDGGLVLDVGTDDDALSGNDLFKVDGYQADDERTVADDDNDALSGNDLSRVDGYQADDERTVADDDNEFLDALDTQNREEKKKDDGVGVGPFLDSDSEDEFGNDGLDEQNSLASTSYDSRNLISNPDASLDVRDDVVVVDDDNMDPLLRAAIEASLKESSKAQPSDYDEFEMAMAISASAADNDVDKVEAEYLKNVCIEGKFKQRGVPDDGDCLFAACLEADSDMDPSNLRTETYNYMKENADEFKVAVYMDLVAEATAFYEAKSEGERVRIASKLPPPVVLKLNEIDLKNPDSIDTVMSTWFADEGDEGMVQTYLSSMSKGKWYGGQGEWLALSRVLNKPLRVYSRVIGEPQDIPYDKAYVRGQFIHLYYDAKHRHYERLDLVDADL